MSAFGTKRTFRDDLPFVRFWSEADIGRRIVPIVFAAFDPKRTKAPSKSRSAVVLLQWYLPLRSTGEIAGETTRVHHAAGQRCGRMATGGSRAAGRDAGDWFLRHS